MKKSYVSNRSETPRMFRSKIFESLSKTFWFVPIIIYIPVIVYHIFESLSAISAFQAFFSFIVGIFIWSFTEYILHRFIFHYEPSSYIGKRLHWILHGVHHDFPRDPLRLVMPPAVSLPLYFLFSLIFYFLFGASYSDAITAGFILGYLIYDTLHYAFHHFAFRNKLFLNLKSHHMSHHYKNSDLGFGVSNKLWDYIFGTKS